MVVVSVNRLSSIIVSSVFSIIVVANQDNSASQCKHLLAGSSSSMAVCRFS